MVITLFIGCCVQAIPKKSVEQKRSFLERAKIKLSHHQDFSDLHNKLSISYDDFKFKLKRDRKLNKSSQDKYIIGIFDGFLSEIDIVVENHDVFLRTVLQIKESGHVNDAERLKKDLAKIFDLLKQGANAVAGDRTDLKDQLLEKIAKSRQQYFPTITIGLRHFK